MEYTATRGTGTPKIAWDESEIVLPTRHPGDSWWLCFRSNVAHKRDSDTGEEIWFEAAAPGLDRRSPTYYRAGEVYALTEAQVPKKYRKIQKRDENGNPKFIPNPSDPRPGAPYIEDWEYTDPDPMTGERRIRVEEDGPAHFIRLPDEAKQAEDAVRRFRTNKEMPFGVLADRDERSPQERAAALAAVGESDTPRRAVRTGADRPATAEEMAANAGAGVQETPEEAPAQPAAQQQDVRAIVKEELGVAMRGAMGEMAQAIRDMLPQQQPPPPPPNKDELLEQLAEQAGVAPVVLKQALQNQARDVLAEPNEEEARVQREQDATAEADAQAAVAAATGDLEPVAEVAEVTPLEVPPPEIPDGRKPWQVLEMGRNQWYARRKKDPVEANEAVAAALKLEGRAV